MSILAVAEPDPVGGTLVGTVTSPFNQPGFFSGTITTDVYSGGTNPLGGLTFTYRVTNATSSANAINRLTGIDYGGFLTDVSYNILTGGGTVPTSIDRGPGTGGVVGFNFIAPPLGATQLLPGQTSALLVVQTNAPAFTQTQASIIDGSATSVPSLGPAIPEPASVGLAGLAIAGLALRRRSH